MISKPFKIEHLDIINPKTKDTEEIKQNISESEYAYTFIKDDRIIFCCGIFLVAKGVGICWVVPSIYVDKYARTFYLTIKNLLLEYRSIMNLHRVHTMVDDKFTNWIEKLGFYREATLKQITSDKKDQHLYVRLWQ